MKPTSPATRERRDAVSQTSCRSIVKSDVKICSECRAEIDAKARRCRYCGAKSRPQITMAHILTPIAAIVLVLSLANRTLNETANVNETTSAADAVDAPPQPDDSEPVRKQPTPSNLENSPSAACDDNCVTQQQRDIDHQWNDQITQFVQGSRRFKRLIADTQFNASPLLNEYEHRAEPLGIALETADQIRQCGYRPPEWQSRVENVVSEAFDTDDRLEELRKSLTEIELKTADAWLLWQRDGNRKLTTGGGKIDPCPGMKEMPYLNTFDVIASGDVSPIFPPPAVP